MKTVVITGAGRGIGLALTKQFIQNGYQVVGTYRNAKSAPDFLKLAESNKSVFPVQADVTDEKTFTALKDQLKKIAKIEILINNSGVIGEKKSPLSELNIDKAAETLQVNTLGPMRITKLALPYLSENAIVAQITSLMGSIADNSSGGYYDYRMSKAALNMFNMCLTKELPQITCLALHPGWVQTDMGGAGATVTVADCAKGLFKVITSSSLQQSGQFLDFTGKQLQW